MRSRARGEQRRKPVVQRRSHTRHSLRVSAVDLQLAVRTTDAAPCRRACVRACRSLGPHFEPTDRDGLRPFPFFSLNKVFFLFSGGRKLEAGPLAVRVLVGDRRSRGREGTVFLEAATQVDQCY